MVKNHLFFKIAFWSTDFCNGDFFLNVFNNFLLSLLVGSKFIFKIKYYIFILTIFSFAHLGDGKTLGLLTNVPLLPLPLPPLDRLHQPYITPALNYTSLILHRPYITPALYYTCLLLPTFNLTTNHGQNYRYFRPCFIYFICRF